MLYRAIAFVIGGTIHEAAHAWVAYLLGDRTPKRDGRLTLNPIRHIEPFGFILVLLAGIGWARPVITNPAQFRVDRKFGMLLVALAGPVSNLLLAIILIPVFLQFSNGITPLAGLLYVVISLNLLLCTFNLLPIYPLDGEKVLRGLLPMRYLGFFHQMESYGQFILLLIVFIQPLNRIFVTAPYLWLKTMLGLGF
ncbi:MAG: peptidase [Bacilli bacterium]|nr:peptidase [Bacilli bacterium]